MTEVLELPELPKDHGPTEGHVLRGRVEAELHPERPSQIEFLGKPAIRNDLGRTG